MTILLPLVKKKTSNWFTVHTLSSSHINAILTDFLDKLLVIQTVHKFLVFYETQFTVFITNCQLIQPSDESIHSLDISCTSILYLHLQLCLPSIFSSEILMKIKSDRNYKLKNESMHHGSANNLCITFHVTVYRPRVRFQGVQTQVQVSHTSCPVIPTWNV